MTLSRETLELVDAILDSVSLPVSADDFLAKAQAIDTAKREIRAALQDEDASNAPQNAPGSV